MVSFHLSLDRQILFIGKHGAGDRRAAGLALAVATAFQHQHAYVFHLTKVRRRKKR